MAHGNNFDERDKAVMPCAVCEAMCPEAVDGTLTAAEQTAFDRHVAGCVSCAEELSEAHRGAAWMQMLKGHTPEPPAMLLAKILAETSGAAAGLQTVAPPVRQNAPHEWGAQAIGVTEYLPQAKPLGRWASFSARLSEAFSLQSMTASPRLAMTAAMAFFSIALTLNMAGVRVKDIRLSDLRPSAVRRSVADAGASSIRSFQNLRVVYEFESRVSDMRSDGGLGKRYEDDGQDSGVPFAGSENGQQGNTQQNNTQPQQNQDQKQPDKPRGSSSLEFPLKPADLAEKGA